MVAPALGAGRIGLLQVHRRIALYGVAGVVLVVAWYVDLVQPLFLGSAQPRWGVVAAQRALAVLLREVALVRWRAADWPRGQGVVPLA